MWAMYLQKDCPKFGNNTNNKIESENGKLKTLSNHSSLAYCVRSLLFHNSILSLERQYRQFLDQSTEVIFKDIPSDMHPMLGTLTDFAADKVRLHLKGHGNISVGSEHEGFYAESDSGRIYSVCLSPIQCSCTFHRQSQLTC